MSAVLTHLRKLEAESIHILREVVAECQRPVLLYSVGKDSSVLLRLAQKAFHPGRIPFPLLHIDTSYKFREMIEFRDRYTAELGVKLIVHTNRKALEEGATPFAWGTQRCCGALKTTALLDALREGGFDAAIGGARRDEERSRAKERIFSFRAVGHRWDPKAQRPELWNLYNTRINARETVRVFPLSNWTEADIWQYIRQENIPIVPLYFAARRPVVNRYGQWIMVDDHRLPLEAGEEPELRMIRFRTLGCYPLTAGIESTATTLDEIVAETLGASTSERQGRIIDHDGAGSMERKKQEGYF
jgi:sulfate adenylyltransferase subunit 2